MDARRAASPSTIVRRALVCIATCLIAATGTAQEPPLGAPVAPGASQPDREIQIASDAFVKDPALPKWVLPHAIAEPKATGPAVLVLSDSQILVADSPVAYSHRAVRVNDASVLSALGRVSLVFIPAYQRMVLHTLRVVRDGAVLDRLPVAQVRFLQRETGLESNVYSGLVTASILVDDLRVGDTLEIAFSTIGANPVFGPTFSGAEGWDQFLPIDERRVVLNAPVRRAIRWRTHGDLTPAIAAPVEKIVGDVRVLTFEGKGLASLSPEAAVPNGVSTARWIEFSEYANWNGVATWAESLFVDHEPPSAERKSVVATLMAKPTVEERVVGALEFVQSQVRYFSVSLGTSSHRPTLPNTVLTRRYGDCKDKSLLLVTLLGDMGIASTPALAKLGNRTGFDDRLPTPLAFDHVIVAVTVDGAPYWLDATRMGQHGRLARMGQVHDGAEILPASAGTQSLVRIAVPNREELARDDRIEDLVLTKLDGDGTLHVTATQHGVSAEAFRAVRGLLTQERLDTVATNEMEKRYPGAKLVEPVKLEDDPVENRMTLTYAVSLPKPAKRVGSAWQVPIRPDNILQIFTLPPDAKRRAPVAVRFPVNAHYRFAATLPDEVAAAIDPSSITVDDPAFVSTQEFSFRGNRWVSEAVVRTVADRVAVADLPRLRDDLQKVQRGLPGGVLVRDTDLRKTGFLGIGRKDLATTLKSRQEDIVKRTSATIQAGRLTGGDLARAYCDRAAAQLTLDHAQEATSDADKAVEIDPNDPEMLVCRGQTRLGNREFAPAIDDFSRAVVMGADGGHAYHLRGQAKFHLDRFADAAADFAKANAADRDDRSTLSHDLWRAMAYRRLKQALPDDLQKRAATDPRGDWPRPALALLADRLGPDEVGPLAAKKPGDAAELNGTEADFFVGEWYLSRGELPKARESFAASRARGVIIYTEYAASGLELEKLDRGGSK